MTRYLVLWHENPLAPWPKEPSELSKLREQMWNGIDNLLKKGEIKEFGFFLDGTSGYAVGEKDTETTFKNISMFLPYYASSVHEIVPYEKGKEILAALWKAQAKMSHGQSQR